MPAIMGPVVERARVDVPVNTDRTQVFNYHVLLVHVFQAPVVTIGGDERVRPIISGPFGRYDASLEFLASGAL